MNLIIVHNIKRSRFEVEVGGEYAFVEYQFYKEDIAIMHTYVPHHARGQGVASALAKYVLDYVRDQKLNLLVFCPTVARYIRGHPEYEVLLDKVPRQ